MSTFYGAKVSAKEVTPYVPRPLAPEFSLAGHKQAEVHIHGSFVPSEMPGSDEEGEEEDEENMNPVQLMQKQLQGLVGKPSGLGEVDDDDEDSESDEDDESDDDEGVQAMIEGDDDDDKIATRYGGKKHVEIVELDENGTAVPQGLEGAAGAITSAAAGMADAGAKFAAAAGDDDEDDESDDDEDSEDENEDNAAVDAVAAQHDAQQVIDSANAALQQAEVNGVAKAAQGEDDDDEDSDEDSESSDDGGTPAEMAAVANAQAASAAEDAAEDDSDEEDEDEESEEEEAEEQPQEQRPANNKRKAPGTPEDAPTKKVKKTAFANGFEVTELQASSNPRAARASAGQRVAVKFTGRLQSNKKVFDSTKGNKTFSFRLGVGEVIKGWDKGIAGMRVGDKRQLVVPPTMAYGDTGVRGVIPKNATLVFDVELCQVHNSS